MRVYESVRKSRAETLVELAAASSRTMHAGEGSKEKAERDAQFKAMNEATDGKAPVPDKWADADVQRMIYQFDCVKAAAEAFERDFERLLELQHGAN